MPTAVERQVQLVEAAPDNRRADVRADDDVLGVLMLGQEVVDRDGRAVVLRAVGLDPVLHRSDQGRRTSDLEQVASGEDEACVAQVWWDAQLNEALGLGQPGEERVHAASTSHRLREGAIVHTDRDDAVEVTVVRPEGQLRLGASDEASPDSNLGPPIQLAIACSNATSETLLEVSRADLDR
ncbi:hypothetical protein D3C75_860600 [compost metagenome]